MIRGRKVGSLKRRVRSHVVRGKFKSCTPLWREAHFEVKMQKSWGSQSTFHVLMSKTCTPLWREARFQVKLYKTRLFGPLFEVSMSKNCTPLWREAHFQVKMLKNWRSRSPFWSSAVEKLHAAVARRTFPSQNVQNTYVLARFLMFRCRKISQVVS